MVWLARAALFVAGAAGGYVVTRAAFIFLGWAAAAIAAVLLVAVAYVARRGEGRFVALGLVSGTAVGAVALSL